MTQFSLTSIFSDFASGDLEKEELEEIIKEAIKKECRGTIREIKYNKAGVQIIMDDDEIIDIEIDWNEIIIK